MYLLNHLSTDQLLVYNLSDPLQPVLELASQWTGTYHDLFAVDKGRVVLANSNSGVIDAYKLSATDMTKIASWPLTSLTGMQIARLWLEGDYLFLGLKDGRILPVYYADSSNPVILDALKNSDGSHGSLSSDEWGIFGIVGAPYFVDTDSAYNVVVWDTGPQTSLIPGIATGGIDSNKNLQIEWTKSDAGYLVEMNADLSNSQGWQPASVTPVVQGNKDVVKFPVSNSGQAYFRLAWPH